MGIQDADRTSVQGDAMRLYRRRGGSRRRRLISCDAWSPGRFSQHGVEPLVLLDFTLSNWDAMPDEISHDHGLPDEKSQ